MSLRLVPAEHLFTSGPWLVRITCTPWLPGDSTPRQLFEVQEDGHVRFRTIDVGRVRAALGDALFCELREVEG